MKLDEKSVDTLQQVEVTRLNERILIKLQAYWELTKSKQTFLLLITGWAGYRSAGLPVTDWTIMLSMLGSLYLAISGSTVLNMYIDRDIDARMPRTIERPLPAKVLRPLEALTFGLLISLLGIIWAFSLNTLFGLVVMAGLCCHAFVYTSWLKRQTPFSVIPGGVAGGMPVLAGRVLGTGTIDIIGVLLVLAILMWIPIHILTFAMRYAEDYKMGQVPTFPSIYGEERTRQALVGATILTGVTMMLAIVLNAVRGPYLLASILAVVVLIGFTIYYTDDPSPERNFTLFKVASLYMLVSMLIIGLAG
ncbi:MAG TPA: protoheme IX farnesyltransferase [Syntrophomonadaceae bacterium]|nr:protoheme IX farnesyltransferase [Syntrophomonadaceae bacterium]